MTSTDPSLRQYSPSNEARTDQPTNSAAMTIDEINDRTDRGIDYSQEKLVMWQGIALLTADCMGVGILGLPNDMKLLGWAVGLSFLVLNCPINYYAGNLLSILALNLESDNDDARIDTNNSDSAELELVSTTPTIGQAAGGDARIIRRRFSNRKRSYQGLPQQQQQENSMNLYVESHCDEGEDDVTVTSNNNNGDDESRNEHNCFPEAGFQDEIVPESIEDMGTLPAVWRGDKCNHKGQTSDLINITSAVFSPNDNLTSRIYILLVKILYYTNLFLVLGDYILVMSRSVTAFFGEENICLPTAGAIASTLMFGLCQLRTMANLGRSVSLASLLALLIVLAQCLFHHRQKAIDEGTMNFAGARDLSEEDTDDSVWGKFSSLAGVGFAVGSQKLFLNIRYELKDRDEASKVLAGSLFTYGSAYLVVVLLAGPNPPSFLFESIPEGWGRKFAGLLLWFHVAVSYAINSQALCASLNHMLPESEQGMSLTHWCTPSGPATRWFGITLVVSVSSYLVSNAIPFFKDLVALIGALTSVPLCLTLPAILHRRIKSIHLLLPDRSCISPGSYMLLLYSFIFLFVGLIGALLEIEEDWLSQGKPFACHQLST